MNPLNIILTILLFLSGVLTVILVLMHSGKGTGVSDMIASSLYNAGTGSGILEKNLDRLTVITATVFHRLRHRHGTHLPAGNHRLGLAALNLVGASDFGRPLFSPGLTFSAPMRPVNQQPVL